MAYEGAFGGQASQSNKRALLLTKIIQIHLANAISPRFRNPYSVINHQLGQLFSTDQYDLLFKPTH